MADNKPFSPLWWVDKLENKLRLQQQNVARFEKYFDGEQPLPIALSSKEYRKEFEAMLREVRDNWMPLVVEAVAERLNPEGFRVGEQPAADKDASVIWQRNFLDADAKLAHTCALTTGRCPIMVWAGSDGKAEITVEHPGQVVVAYEEGSRRRRAAALKMWEDEWTGESFANLYLPDSIWKFHRRARDSQPPDLVNWSLRGEMLANPTGVVPVFELRNRLRLRDGFARSELMEVTSTQDQIDKTTIDMLVAAEFAAFRQRWATGIEVVKDKDGNEVDPYSASSGVDRLLWTANDAARFGTFDATQLDQYVKVIESRVMSMARRTRTPPHYMLGSGAQLPNGESIKAAETGLVAKVRDRHITFGETWEEVIRFALQIDQLGGETPITETIWADPESRTESEHVDAVMKKKALGVPVQQLWEDLGYSPQQIGRFREMLLDEALQRLLADPTALPVPAPNLAG